MGKHITPRSQNYSQWYLDVIKHAGLAENSDVRGCMIIKPYGYSLWENMQHVLDKMFKSTGHSNAYFPLLVPKSYLTKEARHVEGFAKECAVVTHYRLKSTEDKQGVMVDSKALLEEELIIRPTSETMIWSSYKKWIQSYRDLPLLINQWANVMRWEMRPRLFLRTSEFLWQEGHTAHATQQEAEKETLLMLDTYVDFVENFMAVPVIKGKKSKREKFPGAIDTYCIEALMQDGKALQVGTSHFLGQNFSKAFNVQFAEKDGTMQYVWGTSWGVSTRLIGGLIMTHADDDGLIIPPKIASIHIVIIPVFKTDDELQKITEKANYIISHLQKQGYGVKFDDRTTHRPGFKFAEYELKGIPIRITIGSHDLEKNVFEIARRDTKEKITVPFDKGIELLPEMLNNIQNAMYKKALQYTTQQTTLVDSYDEFKQTLNEKGGFLLAHWDGSPQTEAAIKEETGATIRCIPLAPSHEKGLCIYSGNSSEKRVIFALSY